MPSWWVTQAWEQSPLFLFVWVFWVISSIVLHELGHGFAAIRCGDETPRETGHITLNPIVHMGTTSLIMFALVGIAWGAMPVNPSRFRGRFDDAIVSASGPSVNLGLFTICAVGAAASNWLSLAKGIEIPQGLHVFMLAGAWLNLTLFVFNLLPFPPLDGFSILASFMPRLRTFMRTEKGAALAVVATLLLFMWGGSRVFDLSMEGTRWTVGRLTGMFLGSGPGNP